MAVGPFNIYSETLEAMLKSSFVDLSSQNMVAVLLTSSHTPDLEAHATYADISTQEVADADYAAQDLTGEVVTDETAGAYFDSGDISFGASVTITGKYLVLLAGTAASLSGTDKLLGIMDLDDSNTSASVSSANGAFSITAPAGGWFSLNRQ